jgi:anthranilate synthase component 1
MKYRITTISKKLLADTLTPVNIYLKLRDVFAGSILLESSDYHGQENSLSMICCDPIASFQVNGLQVDIRYPDGGMTKSELGKDNPLTSSLETFVQSFETDTPQGKGFTGNGLFGYLAFDAVRFFEDVQIDKKDNSIPDAVYKLYRYVIIVNHFTNELTVSENYFNQSKGLETIEQLIFSNRFSTYSFTSNNHETSNVTDEEFLSLVRKGMEHCQRGDVFQLVLSRRFTSGFKGDEFNVYRALRSINPSPYLFYFD